MDHSDTLHMSKPTAARAEMRAELAPGATAPPIKRGSMVPAPWLGLRAGLARAWAIAVGREQSMPPAHLPAPWRAAAARRRAVLLVLIACATVGASVLLAKAHPMPDAPVLHALEIGLFSLLFAWVSAGFFTALMGFFAQLRHDPHTLSLAGLQNRPLHVDARTAVIMPICNENVSTVFAGLRATCESLAGTGMSSLFDVYVLSDSSDPAVIAAEREAWAALRETLGGGARVYYRWRKVRTRRKAGNVADFCRRWGSQYRYMVVLDADSVMTGDCLVSLARLMEAHPKAGIIQTAPKTCGLETLHARVQQFAGRTTGRLFTAGMQYWQLGESHYWGHNAIIRTEAFMRHCSLASLPRPDGSHNHILSHDFVEAALMGRAGYETWLVPELSGSYEQQPGNLMEELQRDRRWCEGNLQNANLIAEPGLSGTHRAMLITGVMSYVSAPLWLAYLVLGMCGALLDSPMLRVPGTSEVPGAMIGLWLATGAMLFAPRVLGVVSILLRREQRLYGGAMALIGGSIAEAALSLLQAPIRMVAHSAFVLAALTGLKLTWKSPSREAQAIEWLAASRQFGTSVLILSILFAGFSVLRPEASLWLLPVTLPLLAAIPLMVLTSREAVGSALRQRNLLMIPEEIFPPMVLRHAWMFARRHVVSSVLVTGGAAKPNLQVVPARKRANEK
jgi:membrane glycosyltransferase